MATRTYDVVVYGATSFVGRLLAQHLFERHGADGELRWALAGRSPEKLDRLRSELGPGAEALPTIVADAGDETALRAMCEQTDALASTVGPYMLYGSSLVAACAATGTDYCDLTGEIPWIRRMLDAHEATARRNGARIVHCCGFDSIPSDLGVHFLQQQARARTGQTCERVRMRVKAVRGAFSGGTAASLMNVVKMAGEDPDLRRLLADPYAICPQEDRPDIRQPSVQMAEYDSDLGRWAAPFIMAAINTRVVHRTNALAGYAYGREFRYDEAMLTGAGLRGRASAVALAMGLGAFTAGAAIKPTRWLLERFVLPEPGEGPSPEAQAAGFFDLRLVGETGSGGKLQAKVTGQRDPGYGATSRMLGEAVTCLATEIGRDEVPGGFWTPATALGDRLIERLTAHAGMRFELIE